MKKYAAPVRGNLGIAAHYRSQLDRLIADMSRSVLSGVTSTNASDVSRVLSLVGKQWIARFDEAAPDIAQSYVRSTFKHVDSAFRNSLKSAGWTVNPTPTQRMIDSARLGVTENVSLIRSIPQKYLTKVEQAVFDSFLHGRRLDELTSAIRALHPMTARRAKFIARDQTNKLTAIVTATRQDEVGIMECEWVHSGGGKKPRPDHVKAGADHVHYNVKKGCHLNDGWVLPGELPNCRCVGRPLLPFQ